MTTYVISQQPNLWNVHRYGETVTMLGAAPSEEQAMQIAMEHARKEAPSCILRIALNGAGRLVAMFADEVQQQNARNQQGQNPPRSDGYDRARMT
jgi:hypothetical protein